MGAIVAQRPMPGKNAGHGVSFPEVFPGAFVSFPFQQACFLVFAKLEEDSGQVALGREGIGMIRSGVLNAEFQHFPEDLIGGFEMTLFEQDRPQRAQGIQSYRVLGAEGRESLIQEANGGIDFAGTPKGDGKFVDRLQSIGMTRPLPECDRIQRRDKVLNLARLNLARCDIARVFRIERHSYLADGLPLATKFIAAEFMQ